MIAGKVYLIEASTNASEKEHGMGRVAAWTTQTDKSALCLLSFLLVLDMHHRPWVHRGGSPAGETVAASSGSAAGGKKAGLTPGKRRSVAES